MVASGGSRDGGSDKEHDDNLGDDDSHEHAEGIDRRIADRRGITLKRIVGIAQSHGVGHTAAEHAADGTKVVAVHAQHDDTYY